MSREEIIAMAREAGAGFVCDTLLLNGMDADDFICRFVALVAAKEREACAQVCDELAELNRTAPTDSMWQWGECAVAIRARSAA